MQLLLFCVLLSCKTHNKSPHQLATISGRELQLRRHADVNSYFNSKGMSVKF